MKQKLTVSYRERANFMRFFTPPFSTDGIDNIRKKDGNLGNAINCLLLVFIKHYINNYRIHIKKCA